MFKFWYEKFAIVFIPLFAFFSFFMLLIYAFYTTFFVEPPDKAQFVQDIRQEQINLPDNKSISLDSQNLTDNELKNWITMAVSDSLSFNKDSFSEISTKIRPYFTDAGFDKYQDYLINSGVAENIRTNNFDMSVYIENPPLYLNSSVINNTFKWLYQMPVVISFYPKGQIEDPSVADKFINSKLSLRLQVTRAKVDDDPNAIQIEDWVVVSQ